MRCSQSLKAAKSVLESSEKTAGSDTATSRYYYYPPFAFGVEYFGKQNNVLLCRSNDKSNARDKVKLKQKGGFSLLGACKAFVSDLLRDGIKYVLVQCDEDKLKARLKFCQKVLQLSALQINENAFVVKLR